MYTRIIVHKNRVKIYFKSGEHFIRYNTGIEAPSKDLFYRGNPNSLFNPINEIYEDYNKKIRETQDFIEKIISQNLHKTSVKLTTSYIRKILLHAEPNNHLQKKFLIEHYEDFLNKKQEYFYRYNHSKISIKDYNSLKQTLIDYHLEENTLFELSDINFDFVEDFILYLTRKHKKFEFYNNINDELIKVLQRLYQPTSRKYKHRFKADRIAFITKGEMGDNTIQKRIDNLKEFIDYLNQQSLINWSGDHLRELKKKYRSYPTSFTTLTWQEVKDLYNYKINFDHPDGRYHFVRDAFVLMCVTSLRYSDLITLDKEMDVNFKENTLKKYNQKTIRHDGQSVISINSIIKEILVRYNCNFNRYSNVNFNHLLKELCEATGLFNDKFLPKKKIQGQIINLPPVPRYKVISTHTGRRSAITNLISKGHELVRIMSISGHRSLKMMSRYYDAYRNNNADNIDLMESLDFQSDNKSSQIGAQKNNQ
jgi:integrase